MPTFIALRQQKSEGCSYSIACGMDHEIFEADTPEEAFKILKNRFHWNDFENGETSCDPFSPESEFRLAYAKLYQVEGDYTPLIEQWYDDTSSKLRASEDAKSRASKEAEFARLKKELGK